MQKSDLINFLLLILSGEKVIQHVFVTLALLSDFGGIRSTVAIDYRALAISGAILADLWAFLLKKGWVLYLLTAAAAFDFVGEFIAQVTFPIAISISILAAVTLLI